MRPDDFWTNGILYRSEPLSDVTDSSTRLRANAPAQRLTETLTYGVSEDFRRPDARGADPAMAGDDAR